MRILSAALLVLILTVSQAYAEGAVIPLGPPEQSTLSPVSNENVIDVYTRQLAYREVSLDFRRRLLQRQESFAAVQRQAVAQYEEALAAMNATREDERGETR